MATDAVPKGDVAIHEEPHALLAVSADGPLLTGEHGSQAGMSEIVIPLVGGVEQQRQGHHNESCTKRRQASEFPRSPSSLREKPAKHANEHEKRDRSWSEGVETEGKEGRPTRRPKASVQRIPDKNREDERVGVIGVETKAKEDPRHGPPPGLPPAACLDQSDRGQQDQQRPTRQRKPDPREVDVPVHDRQQGRPDECHPRTKLAAQQHEEGGHGGRAHHGGNDPDRKDGVTKRLDGGGRQVQRATRLSQRWRGVGPDPSFPQDSLAFKPGYGLVTMETGRQDREIVEPEERGDQEDENRASPLHPWVNERRHGRVHGRAGRSIITGEEGGRGVAPHLLVPTSD